MIIPAPGSRVLYKYSASIINLNIIFTVEKAPEECSLCTFDIPFSGKYRALIKEDEDYLEILKFEKNVKGIAGDKFLEIPVVKINKKEIVHMGMPIGDKFILSLLKSGADIKIGSKIYNNCYIFSLFYDTGKYSICVKDGAGIIYIRNIVDGQVKDEIYRDS